jgi:pimeloyl-ACP methyl ester carboxylesterase
MSADAMEPLAAGLAGGRRVIVPEMQGHARTADADRPITYEGMADDAAALMRSLGIGRADVVGYSMGAGVTVQLAIRHPALVRRCVVVSGSFAYEGMHAAAIEMFPSISPEMFAGTPIEDEYRRLAPDPDAFPRLVQKLKELDTTPFTWADDVRKITAPMLIIVGDSDVVTLDHTVEFFRLVGGGVMGDMAGLPESQLAVLPATTHFMPPGSGVMDRAEWMLPMIDSFLAA